MLKYAEKRLGKLLPSLVKIRRHLHRNPEIGYVEFATAELISRELADAGLVPRRLGDTGVVAIVRGKRRGKTIALRADIDALRLTERTGLAYASENGCMHACGHDGHTAILLGAARILAGLTDKFAGNVKLIFQPAEEGGAGAKKLCDLGVMTRPKVGSVFGLHGFNDLPVGWIGVKDGPFTACADKFYITVKGKGAHGACPDKAVDPIVIAAKIVEGLQTIVSREISPASPAVVTIGMIHGGTADNIIPAEVEMCGTLRSYDLKVRDAMIASLKRIARSTAAAMRGKASVRMDEGYPATINDRACTDVVRQAGGDALGPDKAAEITTAIMGAEDFSYYLAHAPGAFFRLGTGDGTGRQGPAHNPYFDFNDKAIAPGVMMFVAIVRRLLGLSVRRA